MPKVDAKSLFRLALPDRDELGRYEVPIDGVPGIEEEGVNSPLSKFPPLAPGPRLCRSELSRSSTSATAFFLGVEGPAFVYKTLLSYDPSSNARINSPLKFCDPSLLFAFQL